jgi:hypothetical protein
MVADCCKKETDFLTRLLLFFKSLVYLDMNFRKITAFCSMFGMYSVCRLAAAKVSRWSYAAMIEEETNLYSLRAILFNYKCVIPVCHATAPNAFGLGAIPLGLWYHWHISDAYLTSGVKDYIPSILNKR